MLRILSIVISLIAVFGLAILFAGYTSPDRFTGSAMVDVPYSRELSWAELVNIRTIPQKKQDVVSVDVVDQYGKLFAWKENLKDGGYRIYRMIEYKEPERLAIELTESSYELKGIWTFDLENDSGGTRILIAEDSTLTDIKLKGWRYFFGRNHDLLVWIKYIKVGLVERLLSTP